MEQKEFESKKNDLLELIDLELKKSSRTDSEKFSLIDLRNILKSYTFKNKMEYKGLISRTIIDSLDLPFSIGEKFINFDNSLK